MSELSPQPNVYAFDNSIERLHKETKDSVFRPASTNYRQCLQLMQRVYFH